MSLQEVDSKVQSSSLPFLGGTTNVINDQNLQEPIAEVKVGVDMLSRNVDIALARQVGNEANTIGPSRSTMHGKIYLPPFRSLYFFHKFCCLYCSLISKKVLTLVLCTFTTWTFFFQ